MLRVGGIEREGEKPNREEELNTRGKGYSNGAS